MKMWRQGDCLIVEADKPRQMMKPVPDRVLLHGEAAGHKHQVEGAMVYAINDERFIDANRPFKVVHEEHDTIEIPEGFYKLVRQREYDEKAIRYVAD